MATLATQTPQRMKALVGANDARSGPAQAKRRIRELGHKEACRILLDETELIASMRIYAFLEAVPTIGEVKTRKILVRRQIWPLKRVGQLTLRQRQIIALDVSYQARGLGYYRPREQAA